MVSSPSYNVFLRHTTAVLTVIADPSTTVITGVESASLGLLALVNRPVTVAAATSVAVMVG